jgi:hypothetical protein
MRYLDLLSPYEDEKNERNEINPSLPTGAPFNSFNSFISSSYRESEAVQASDNPALGTVLLPTALQGLCIQCAGPADRFGELYAYSDPQFGQVWLHRPCRSFWVRTQRPHPSIEHLFRCVGDAAVH